MHILPTELFSKLLFDCLCCQAALVPIDSNGVFRHATVECRALTRISVSFQALTEGFICLHGEPGGASPIYNSLSSVSL